MKHQRIALWIAGSVILIALNFHRNIKRTLIEYDWASVTRGVLHRSIATQGVLEATKVSIVTSSVDETVLQKMMEEGQSVQKDQPLMELSRTKTKLSFDQQRNSYNNAEADFKKAQREVALQKKLLRSLAVSRSQVEDSEQALNRAEATFRIAKQELDIAQEKLNSTTVRAPIAGVVLKYYANVGEALSSGKNVVAVGDLSKFIVRANVDELDIQHVKIGQAVNIVADAFPDKPMKGTIAFIASQAERDSFAKIEVKIDVIEADRASLKHNLSVRVYILTDDIPDALSVPIKAIQKKSGDTAWILVRNKFNLIAKRKIKLGKTAGDDIEVLSGLVVGERVAVDKPVTGDL